MSKKCKGMVLNTTTPYGLAVYEDSKARLKHQTLVQDYQELRKETDVVRSKLEATKQRKIMLAAEVRLLRRRYGYLMKTKIARLAENEKLVKPPNSMKQKAKKVNEAGQRILPPVPKPQPKKKRCTVKEIGHNHEKILLGGKMKTRKENINQKEIMHGGIDSGSRNNSIAAFDLNRDSSSGKEAFLPTRAPPIFDLNEISNGDEDFHSKVEGVVFEDVTKSNDDLQNDVKLLICRNVGEGSSRVVKRKISWMDPVALSV